MKQGKNNEIDLMLRSLARGPRAKVPLEPNLEYGRENQVSSDHLDADELSSFAEGVVPAPARARFIAHLADCDNCREIVVNLTQASGAAARSETLDQQVGTGFWQKMTALFSPPVLRYAVPAIALTAVIAVSFFGLRQQRGTDLVALNETANSPAPAVAPGYPTESPLAQSETVAPAKTGTIGEFRDRVGSDRDRKTPQDDRVATAKSPISTSDADVPSALKLRRPAESNQPTATRADRQVFSPVPASAPPPPPKAVVNEVDKVGEKEKEELAKREVQALPTVEEKNQTRDEAGRHGPSRNNNAIGGVRRADGLILDGTDSRAKSKKDSEDDGETRTVSGKRFRRQGNAWIDTAYGSSRRTINVSRGSEQFRALVADEPSIRTIAEKLSGVVIVVANGKAYRIQ